MFTGLIVGLSLWLGMACRRRRAAEEETARGGKKRSKQVRAVRAEMSEIEDEIEDELEDESGDAGEDVGEDTVEVAVVGERAEHSCSATSSASTRGKARQAVAKQFRRQPKGAKALAKAASVVEKTTLLA